MPRVSPWSVAKPPAIQPQKTVECPNIGPITLRKLGELELLAAGDRAKEHIRKYVESGHELTAPLSPPVVVPICASLCQLIATLELMEVPEVGPDGRPEKRYEFMDWIGVIFACPDDWEPLRAALRELGETPSGNASAASPSDMAPTTMPSPPPAEITPSAG